MASKMILTGDLLGSKANLEMTEDFEWELQKAVDKVVDVAVEECLDGFKDALRFLRGDKETLKRFWTLPVREHICMKLVGHLMERGKADKEAMEKIFPELQEKVEEILDSFPDIEA